MKPLFVILAQSTTGPVIFIIALLLIAVLIGYLTAWFYAKSVYTPVIKGLEADKAELTNHVIELKDNVGKLNAKVAKRDEKISSLEAEMSELEKEIKSLKNKSKK